MDTLMALVLPLTLADASVALALVSLAASLVFSILALVRFALSPAKER